MEAYISFLIKASLSLVLFYICYKTFLSNETFFRFNRYVIIFGIVICFGISTFNFNIAPDITFAQTAQDISTNEITLSKTTPFPWGTIITVVYFIGMIINFALLSRSLLSLIYSLRHQERIKQDGFTLILMDKEIAPFSWLNFIVLSHSDYKNNNKEIITHEREHIRRRHSIDILFVEAVSLFFWFNPVIWLLKKELRDIHEYQADMGVLKSGIDASKYQLLLIKKAVGSSSYTLANSFNHSKIKKRITMMLKRKSNKWAKVKLVCLIPAALVPAIIFAQPQANQLLAEVTRTTKISELFDANKTGNKSIYESTNLVSVGQTTAKDSISPEKILKFNTLINEDEAKKTVKFTPPVIKGDKDKEKKATKFTPPVITEKDVDKKTIKTPPVTTNEKSEKKTTIKFTPPVIKEDKAGKKEIKTPPVIEEKNVNSSPEYKGTISYDKKEADSKVQIVVADVVQSNSYELTSDSQSYESYELTSDSQEGAKVDLIEVADVKLND